MHSVIHGLSWSEHTRADWLTSEGLRRSLAARAPALTGEMLDFGCGTTPYKDLFSHVSRYIKADLVGSSGVDIEYEPRAALCLSTASVDSVLSTQVLEHVQDPEQYLGECFRVLRPGGHLLLSTHGFWNWHGPSDWRRWTYEGLPYEISKAGFQVLDMDSVCVHKAFLLQFTNMMLLNRLRGRTLTRRAAETATLALNLLGSAFPADMLVASSLRDSRLATCYVVLAIRP